MKLSAIASVFFAIFGVITSMIYMKQRGDFTTGGEKFLLFGLLWVAIAIIIGSSWFLQKWLTSRRSAFEETKSPAPGFGLMGAGILFMIGSLSAFAYTTPSYSRAVSLLDTDTKAAQSTWCYAATKRRRTLNTCFMSALKALKFAKSIQNNAEAKDSFKALLLNHTKTTSPKITNPSELTSLEVLHETIGPDAKVAKGLDDFYLKTLKLYPTRRAAILANWAMRKKRPALYDEQMKLYDQTNYEWFMGKVRNQLDQKAPLDKQFLASKNLVKAATGLSNKAKILANQPRYQAANVAAGVLFKAVAQMPPLLRQPKAYTTRAMTERGHKVISVHKHISVVFDKDHRPIMALRDRGAKIVGAMTLLPPKKATSWSPESLDEWAAVLTKESAPLAQNPAQVATDIKPESEAAKLLNAIKPKDNAKKKAEKLKEKATEKTDASTPDKPKHTMRASYRMDTLWTQDNAIGRAVLGRYPTELRHLTLSWLANHMSVDEQFDDMLKAKLKKEGYKGKTYDTYYKKNKKAFRSDYYSNSYRTGGVYIFPIVTPRTPYYGRSRYRSSGYRSSRSSGYRSSGRSYRSGSYRSSGYRSSGYRSGKN